jgi:MFS family permease
MLGESLQHAYGRSIMLGFHATFSLGGILGASAAWAGAHWHLTLLVTYFPAILVLLPAALIGSRWYVDGRRDTTPQGPEPSGTAPVPVGPAGGGHPGAEPPRAGEPGAGPGAAPARTVPAPSTAIAAPQSIAFKLLLPLCLVMAFAYIGDSTVSNWSAKYLQDVLGSSEQLSTVPYNVYMAMTLLGRALGDLGVRRFGAVTVVRCGTLVAGAGFAVVAAAPDAWTGILGFTLLGLGLCVIVPQTFAAAGRHATDRHGPGASDSAVARLNVFNYVGFLVGSPLVGALGDAWNYRGAMLVPMGLVLVTLFYARSFGPDPRRIR